MTAALEIHEEAIWDRAVGAWELWKQGIQIQDSGRGLTAEQE